MTKDDAEYLNGKIENEGFDYCFMCYSSFKDIEDEKFHELREAYIKSAKDLQKYIDEQQNKEQDG